ncbi:MAG: FHA domain-containing protein [Chloroflexi bacterium]|nr:FHA domain-containing protein [Chloroflexota bacterium]
MKPAPRNIPKSKWLLSMLLLAVLTILPSDALSQEQTQPIQVTHVVTDEFPTVKVRVAAWGTNMVIIPNENLNVFEDGVPFVVDSVAPVDVGVRVAFVIDPGDGVRNTGINLRTVYEIAAEYLETFMVGRPWMMANVDEITVIVQEGDSTEIISPMSSDPALISQQLASYVPPTNIGRPSESGAFTRTALRRGLDELQFVPGDQDKPQALVLFTPGMRADTSDLAERAIEAGIPIHVVMTRNKESSFWEEALKPLASVTGGEFSTNYGSDGLEPMFEQLTRRRQQLEVTYRTNSATAGQRNVTIEIQGSGEIFTATGQYSVELSPPKVEVISPAPGAVINRQAIERGADPSEAEPTFLTVVAEVNFPDGYPREMGPAQLLINGTPAGQGQVVDGRTEITWDIRSYQDIGQVPATLQVVLTDELSLQGQSNPRTVSVNYIEPSSSGTPQWLLIVSLTVAIVSLAAVVFLFLNRQHLAPALAGAGESISDFVERVTGRRTALVAKAYLVPLEGFDELPQRSFEIYGTTAIGRSRKHADLLFHINDEDSAISRLHTTILDEDDHFAIRDEDSTNGTLVNGEKITPLESMRLHDGDIIEVAPIERGGLRFLFQLADVTGEQPDPDDERRVTQPRSISDFEAAADEVGDTYDEYLEDDPQ